MDTPICNFVQRYAQQDSLRLHMPGHKGNGPLGIEQLDITEIDGADSLYEAGGIIRESEQNAGTIFGCHTFYSTEGSSQCIRGMLYLALMYAKQHNQKPLIAAGRNAHKSFVNAAALLDFQILWLYPEEDCSYLRCNLTPEALDAALQEIPEKPCAVYLTSPDYLGNLADISGIARICRKHSVLLLVDNAHGAYLKFLQPSQHPMDLGADLCCDSAHKTLPVLTGGAYLHISHNAPSILTQQAKNALAFFGSTSPSYLILQSLDAANLYLQTYSGRLEAFLTELNKLKACLTDHGYQLCGNEPMKLTILPKPYGYTGSDLAQSLRNEGIICEFYDPDNLVLMFTPETGTAGLAKLKAVLTSIPQKAPITQSPPAFCKPVKCLCVREAALSAAEMVPIAECDGRILAATSVGCPPAVPILVCGERIDRNAIACFQYYGITNCTVVAK